MENKKKFENPEAIIVVFSDWWGQPGDENKI